jgi:glycosyltransferase involved in cell wall biosynthesis
LVEAQACGTPVIAYGAGGATETVRDIRQHPDRGTGLLFPLQTEAALVEAVEAFEGYRGKFKAERARSQACSFAPTIFKQRYLAFVESCDQKFQSRLKLSS